MHFFPFIIPRFRFYIRPVTSVHFEELNGTRLTYTQVKSAILLSFFPIEWTASGNLQSTNAFLHLWGCHSNDQCGSVCVWYVIWRVGVLSATLTHALHGTLICWLVWLAVFINGTRQSVGRKLVGLFSARMHRYTYERNNIWAN